MSRCRTRAFGKRATSRLDALAPAHMSAMLSAVPTPAHAALPRMRATLNDTPEGR